MSLLRSIFMAPLSWIYGTVVAVRNWMYDSGLKDVYVPDIPVISVGNITVGGTGKTPFTEYLIQFLSSYYEVAVLSRGYKRSTKGFILADETSNYRTIGDEPAQIKQKFPSIAVAVCEDRAEGIRRLKELYPELGVIIMDDGFQHRAVKPWYDIVLMDYNRPIYDDHLLPWGSLRDLSGQLERADAVITTKCPDDLKDIDTTIVGKYLNLYSYQQLFFTQQEYSPLIHLFSVEEPSEQTESAEKTELVDESVSDTSKNVNIDEDSLYVTDGNTPVIVMTGIGNPQPFIEYVGQRYNLVDTMIFPDHHSYLMRDIRLLESKLEFAPEGTLVAVTEKDAIKLCNSRKLNPDTARRICYISVAHRFFKNEDSFKQDVLEHVRKNYKNSESDSF